MNRLNVPCTIALVGVFSLQVLAGPENMYLNDSANNLLAVDPASSEVELIGGLAAQFTDIALSPSGQLYGTTARYVYEIDPETGWSTLLGAHGFGEPGSSVGIDALAFDGGGTLFGAGDDVLISIDLETGHGTAIGHLSGYRSAGDLAVDPLGRLLLASDAGMLVEVDRDGSGATPVGLLPYGDVFALAASDDVLYGFRGDDEILSIDLLTGAADLIGHLEADFMMGYPWGAASPPAYMPEPAALLLMALGAMCVYRGRTRFIKAY